MLDDLADISGIAHYRVNPCDANYDCGILELREDILARVDQQTDSFIEDNLDLFREICDHLTS